MTEPANPTSGSNEPALISRADPAFKMLTTEQAQAVGIQPINVELPQILSADLILQIPPTARLDDTLFSFLSGYEYVVIDFKGQSDPLDIPKLLLNIARTALFCQRQSASQPEKVLNLIVSSRYPQDILMRAGAELKKSDEQNWLWQGGPFYQPLAIVVCRDLPLKPAYYEWIPFAPADSNKWREAVKLFHREKRYDLLDLMRKMRPKEFEQMQIDYYNEVDAQERARIDQDEEYVMNLLVQRFAARSSSAFQQTMQNLTPEQLAKVLSDQQLEGLPENLTNEQIEKLALALKEEQRKKLLETASEEELEEALRRRRESKS